MQIIDAVYYSLPSPAGSAHTLEINLPLMHTLGTHTPPLVWRSVASHGYRGAEKGMWLELKTNPILALLPSLSRYRFFLKRVYVPRYKDAYDTLRYLKITRYARDYSCIAVN